MDKYKNKTQEILEQIFNYTGCAINKIEFSDNDGMNWFMVETPDSGFMIGRDGETLRSLNHLVQKIIEKGLLPEEKAPSIFIDINGYHKKRFENLKNIAHMMAERARYFKSNIEIDPMPAYERKIIHMFLEGAKNIKTESEGVGPNRKVIIKYVDDTI